MIRIAICYDDNKCVAELENLLEKYLPVDFKYSYEVFNSGEDLLSFSDNKIPIDILFTDVKLKGLDCIETIKIFKSKQSHCIVFFVAFHNTFIPEMFRLHAFQFLQKPINERDFQIDLKRAIELYKHLHNHLEVKYKGNLINIPISDVVYISVHNKQIIIKTLKDAFSRSGAINEYDKRLNGFGFAHCHKSYLINLKYVERINQQDLELKYVDDFIPISRNYKSIFLKQFNNFNFGTSI